MLINGSNYTLEHGISDEEHDIYVDLIRCDGEPHARVLHDGQLGEITTIRVGSMSLHEKRDAVKQYELANYGTADEAYRVAVAGVLPWNVKAAQVRELIATAPDKAVA